MPRSPRNEAKMHDDNPALTLLEVMTNGGDGFIEAQEARGQRELVRSEVLPVKGTTSGGGDDPIWAKIGVTLGAKVDGDPLFREATLPPGWQKKASDHAMWSHLVDDKGRERASIFYKAAFYDRDAFITVTHRFGIRRVFGEKYNPKAPYQHEVIDCGKRVFVTAEVPQPGNGDWKEHEAIEKTQREECAAWLAERFSAWEDPAAHWD